MPRNPPWTRDELILALDLYFRHSPLHISETHPEVVALSQLLNELPIHRDRPDASRFRNPNSVYMKLCNFLRLDESYHGVGLDAGSKLDKEVWDAFVGDRNRLREIAEAIRAGATVGGSGQVGEAPEECEAPEGSILLRQHLIRERRQSLVERKKRLALRREGVLRCEVCGFVYSQVYGHLGEGFIECHHVKPISQLRPGEATRLGDLALVCANCHRMLHRGGELLTVHALRQIVHEQKRTAVS